MRIDIAENHGKLTDILRGVRSATLLPRPDLHIDEWADLYRILPSETSAITGPWQTSQFEVARPAMRMLTEPGVRSATLSASAQLLKTSALENLLAYLCHLDPAPILIYQPTTSTAKRFDEDKLEPLFLATPVLAALFGGRRALEVKNDKFLSCHKSVPGGFVRVMTSDSPANLAQTSARVVCYDELDKMKLTRDGDPVSLGDERLKGFAHNSLSVRVSTPTVSGHSAIEANYKASDMRKPYFPCPHCGEMHYMKWKHVIWDKDASGQGDPSTARYVCEACGVVWSESDRTRSITTEGNIYGYQTKTFTCCDETQEPEVTRHWEVVEEHKVGYALCRHCNRRAVSNRNAGYWAWEAYHPMRPLSDLVRTWLEAKGDRDKLRNFMNSKLAETFADEVVEVKNVDPDHLAARAEPPWSGVPDGVKVITAGVDVQSGEQGRLEVEIVGWGAGDESWSLGYHIIQSDPSLDPAWTALDEILKAPLEGPDGKRHYIQAACIDTGGHNADQVVNFARSRAARRIWAIKGASEKAGSRQPIWPARISVSRHGGQLYLVGTQSAKDRVATSLAVSKSGAALYMHIPSNRGKSWYDQIVSERQVRVSMDGGREGTMWQPKPGHKRNEALDCRVYAIAALMGLRAQGLVAPAGSPGSGTTPPPEPEIDEDGNEIPAIVAAPPLPMRKPRPRRQANRKASSFWG